MLLFGTPLAHGSLRRISTECTNDNMTWVPHNTQHGRWDGTDLHQGVLGRQYECRWYEIERKRSVLHRSHRLLHILCCAA